MTIWRSGSLVILASLVVSLSGCSSSETPTEPGPVASTSGTVHIVGLNTSAGSLGLPHYISGAPLYPVAVQPGESVEMTRWNFAVTGTHFFVFQPIATQPFFKAIAEVTFNVRNLPASTTAEISATVRVAADTSGAVTAVSERPDIIEIVSVAPPSVALAGVDR